MSKITKQDILYFILTVLIPLFILGVWLAYTEDGSAKRAVDNCQYPTRPLSNGTCDNQDPCDPENIKEYGGKCSDDTTIPHPTKKKPTEVKYEVQKYEYGEIYGK